MLLAGGAAYMTVYSSSDLGIARSSFKVMSGHEVPTLGFKALSGLKFDGDVRSNWSMMSSMRDGGSTRCAAGSNVCLGAFREILRPS